MIIRQFLHQEPVGISYLFGCGGRAAGAVVDPVGKIEPYLRVAEATGMRIHFVIDTHVHADHLSAGRRLSGKPSSTIGFEKRHNEALGIGYEDEFIRFMLADIPPAPPEAAALRAANSGATAAAT